MRQRELEARPKMIFRLVLKPIQRKNVSFQLLQRGHDSSDQKSEVAERFTSRSP